MARSMGHMVLDVTRMAAFSTAGGVNFLNLLEFFFGKSTRCKQKNVNKMPKQDAKQKKRPFFVQPPLVFYAKSVHLFKPKMDRFGPGS